MDPKTFAKLVMEAQARRERSYVNGDYELNNLEAARQACKFMKIDPAFAQVVYLLNEETWNDIQQWCEGQGVFASL